MQAHQSRFKAYLVPPEQLAAEKAPIQAVDLWFKENSVSPVERVMLFVLMYLELRKPQSWAMSSGQKTKKERLSDEGLQLKDLSGPFEFLKRSKSCKFLRDILVEYRPRSLPPAIFEVLSQWESGQYKIVLMGCAPSPQEMLNQQAQGQRVVTLSWSDALQGTLVDGRRDAFEFLLHDLVHADLFFKEPQSFMAQKNFFASLKAVIEKEELLAKGDELFLAGLYYLMSDMNSHQAHLEAHWQAILIQWQLRKENKKPQESLSECGVRWVDSLVQRVRKSSHSASLSSFVESV